MGDFFSEVLRTGIVRVLFVPIVMIAIMYGLWILAAPPSDLNDDDSNAQKS